MGMSIITFIIKMRAIQVANSNHFQFQQDKSKKKTYIDLVYYEKNKKISNQHDK